MHKASIFFLLAIITLLSSGCNAPSSKEDATSSDLQDPQALLSAGEEKFNAYCYSCHNPQSKPDARLAPPPIQMQQAYKEAFPEEEAFKEAFTAFVRSPEPEHALMKAAIDAYGLMPPMSYPLEDLHKIAHYIYHGSFSPKDEEGPAEGPLQTGASLAMRTKSILGKNLMAALNEGGAVHAVDFCNTKAIHFTDSMSQGLNARIQRVSDRPRNPNNRANPSELAVIKHFQQQLKDGAQPSAIIHEEEGGYRFYGPITTNAMCLQCHGEPEKDITPETTKKIQEHYPSDKATGYGLNELRGIWSIYFEPA